MALAALNRSAFTRTLVAGLATSVLCAAAAIGAPEPEAPAPDAKGPTPEAPMVSAPKPEAPATPTTPDNPATSAGSPQLVDMSRLHPAEQLRPQAARLLPTRECVASRVFVLTTAWIPVVDPRTIYTNEDRSRFVGRVEFEALPPEEQKPLEAITISPEFYYNTRYGSPLAYTRVIDLLCNELVAHQASPIKDAQPKPASAIFSGMRWLDFGCGGVVHLQMLAQCGIDMVGVDVDPLLAAVFSEPGDLGTFAQAPISNAEINRDGSVQLVIGSWPGDKATRDRVGTGYDIITSKNTLKNGYINPERETDPKFLVHLGVSNQEFVQSIADMLNPGGYFLIYNLSPKQNPDDKPYLPWADGRSPFSREMFAKAGLEVIQFDATDDVAAREMARALEWDQGPQPMDLEADLFSHYTLVRKPGGAPAAKVPGASAEPAAPEAKKDDHADHNHADHDHADHNH